jgi:hypothetical protein
MVVPQSFVFEETLPLERLKELTHVRLHHLCRLRVTRGELLGDLPARVVTVELLEDFQTDFIRFKRGVGGDVVQQHAAWRALVTKTGRIHPWAEGSR